MQRPSLGRFADIRLPRPRRALGVAIAWTRRHPIRFSVVVFVFGFLLLVGSPAVSLISAWRHLSVAQTLMRPTAGASGVVSHLPELHRELADGHDDLVRARGGLAIFNPAFQTAGHLPQMRALRDTLTFLDLGVALVGTAADATGALEPIGTVQPLTIRAVIQDVDAQQPLFARANAELVQATDILAKIDRTAYRGRLAPVGARLDELAVLLPTAKVGLGLMALSPGLLGEPQAMTYILAGQNEEEKRATGGFIGSLGVARVEQGQVTQLDIRNSYDYAPTDRTALPPPPPLAEWMGFGGWYIRDANWFPDFPTSAAWIEWFWKYYYGTQTDGVIAFDQEAFQRLLTVTGPIDLPDLNERITSANYRDRMLYWLYQANSPTADRRFVRGAKTPFVRELGAAVFKKLLSSSPDDLTRFAPLLVQLLDEKHIIVSLRDPRAAALFAARGWDDHIDAASPDYLYVNDATVSYTKLAPFVRESISETVQLRSDGSVHDSLNVHYQNDYNAAVAHNTYPNEYLGEFWNRLTLKLDYLEGYYAEYLRIYVPSEAIVQSFSGGDIPSTETTETGRKVVATVLQLRSGANREVNLELDLPPGTWSTSQSYRLFVEKQPGTNATPLDVVVTAPAGFSIEGGSGGTRAWNAPLVRDATFDLAITPLARPQ